MADAGRVRHETEPAFVLHSYPFRETSLIVEAFTRNYGRVALVARGARRPRSVMRGVLLAFQQLLRAAGVDFLGRSLGVLQQLAVARHGFQLYSG